MKLLYVKNIHERVAVMDLLNMIGPNHISGEIFAKEMRYLDESEDVDRIKIRINSPGGSVVDGYSIALAMLDSKTPVDTFNGGVAASMAGVLLALGRNREAYDYSRLMIHDPFSNEVDDTKAVESIKGSLIQLLENNSDLSPEVISLLMGEETWFTPTEAEASGLIDSVIPTGRKMKVSNNVMEIYNYAQDFNTNKKQAKMLKITNTLGLNNESNEEVVNAKIVEIMNSLDSTKATLTEKETELTAKDEEIEALKASNAIHVENNAKLVVKEAIESGKINKDKEEEMLKMAKTDLTTFQNFLSAVADKPASITNNLDLDEGKGGSDEPTKHLGMSFRQLEVKNSAALVELKNSDSEKFFQMYKEEYGAEHVENVTE